MCVAPAFPSQRFYNTSVHTSNPPERMLLQEAYVALEANPLPERRLEGLKHLIHTLCEAGQLATLVSFPYASSAVVQRAGR